MEIQEWTSCQVHGHLFEDGHCRDCGEAREPEQERRLPEIWSGRLKIMSGYGSLERKVIQVSCNVAAASYPEAHRRVLEYALSIGLGDVLADRDARVSVDVSRGIGCFT